MHTGSVGMLDKVSGPKQPWTVFDMKHQPPVLSREATNAMCDATGVDTRDLNPVYNQSVSLSQLSYQ